MNWFMDYGVPILGAIILLLGVLDMLAATFGTHGALIGRRLSMVLWSGALMIAERLNPPKRRGLLQVVGTTVALALLSFWIGCIVFGWAMCFSFDGAMEHQADRGKTDWLDHIQFSVSTVSGLGRGLWKSTDSQFWEASTMFASLMGTFVLSFSISFLIPIIQAAKAKRKLAHTISVLGRSPSEILNTYAGSDENPDALKDKLEMLLPDILESFHDHRSYPALHFIHSNEQYESLGYNLVVLDEALTLLKYALPDRYEVPPTIYEPTREVLSQFFNTLEGVYLLKWRGERLEDLSHSRVLKGLEFDDINHASYSQAGEYQELKRRREQLGTLLRNAGWDWNDVYGPDLPSTKKSLELSMSDF